jgi:hypothetical protein
MTGDWGGIREEYEAADDGTRILSAISVVQII